MKSVGSRAPACLALAAMLLLALVPAIGRLATGTAVHAAAPAHALSVAATAHAMHGAQAMPGAHAMAHGDHALHGEASRPPAHAQADRQAHPDQAPVPGGHGGHDCPYCPLLSGLAVAITVPWVPRAPLRHAPWAVRAAANPPQSAPVPALGGQGPPARSVA